MAVCKINRKAISFALVSSWNLKYSSCLLCHPPTSRNSLVLSVNVFLIFQKLLVSFLILYHFEFRHRMTWTEHRMTLVSTTIRFILLFQFIIMRISLSNERCGSILWSWFWWPASCLWCCCINMILHCISYLASWVYGNADHLISSHFAGRAFNA